MGARVHTPDEIAARPLPAPPAGERSQPIMADPFPITLGMRLVPQTSSRPGDRAIVATIIRQAPPAVALVDLRHTAADGTVYAVERGVRSPDLFWLYVPESEVRP